MIRRERRVGERRVEKGSREDSDREKRDRVNNLKRRGTSTLASACCSASTRHCVSPEFPTIFCNRALQQ